MLERQLQRSLDRRRQKGTLRNLTVFPTQPCSSSSSSSSSSAHSPQPHSRQQPLVDFSSNDYLSLSTCPLVRSHFLSLFQSSPAAKLGSTGSRLLDGNSSEYEQLERDLASHFLSSSSLLFNSGYDANVSLFSTLPQPDDFILYDSLVHASVHDGIRKSRTRHDRRLAFQHNSPHHLHHILADLAATGQLGDGQNGSNVFLAVESVYSMDGDTVPLQALIDVLARYVPERARRCVVVDEAHSTAVYGRGGRGYCHALGLERQVDVRLMTFGKGMGASGAVVLCTPVVRHFLINYARPLIFSTSLSYPSLVSIRACLMALRDGRSDERAQSLFQRTRRLVDALQRLASTETAAQLIHLPPHLDPATTTTTTTMSTSDLASSSPSPIIPLLTAEARALAAHLQANGLLARPICYPTVPKGEDRVRICLHADNSVEDVDRLVACVTQWVETRRLDESRQGDKEVVVSRPAAVLAAVKL